jgi:hypothetical protein
MSEREEPALTISESASLERGYRRLLAWYPKWFRHQNEEEARGISRRSDSARAGVAALFGLITLSMLAVLAVGAPMYATADFAAGAAVWFICLVSMVLIVTPASNRYFRPETAALASPAG